MRRHFKIGQRKLKELITEEGQASKMYKRYGLFGISKDETRHRKELLSILRKRKN